jgi:hypothetical protein
VGIGITPTRRLTVMDVSGGFFFSGPTGLTTAYNRIKSTPLDVGSVRDLMIDTNNNTSTPTMYLNTSGNVGLGTTTPRGLLDVLGLLYGRLPVLETDATSATLASSNYNSYVHIRNSRFDQITLPASTAITDGGSFWTLRNATGTTLSITLVNTLTLISPLFIPPSNSVTLAVSGVTSNTLLLL